MFLQVLYSPIRSEVEYELPVSREMMVFPPPFSYFLYVASLKDFCLVMDVFYKFSNFSRDGSACGFQVISKVLSDERAGFYF